MDSSTANKHQQIAVVGFSTIFPGAKDNQNFWLNIINGRDCLTEVPPDHWLLQDYYEPGMSKACKTYVNRGGFIPKIDFDPVAFGIPPKQLASIDNMQTLSLYATHRLLEESGLLKRGKIDPAKVSVLLGIGGGSELVDQSCSKLQRPVWVKAMREHGLAESKVQAIADAIADHYPEWTLDTFPGLLTNVTAGRIANRLNLRGTNCTLDAACASSLAAVNMAVKELVLGDADMVLTGGVDLFNFPFMYVCFSKTPALSRTGDCRPFSDKADGTMLAEGVGIFALRRLEDAERDGDEIFGLINSVGTSSDGRVKSIAAPYPEGQALAIQRAYDKVGYSLADVELVEAHGTSTAAGDVAEFQGLKLAFANAGVTQVRGCGLGSIKSQIGHAKAAAGAAGVFKAVMALHHKVLPPTIKVEQPNPALQIESSPLYLNTVARPWIHSAASSRKASVSAFGFGGSNYHVTVEEYTGAARRPKRFRSTPSELLLVGADDPAGLGEQLAAVALALAARPLELVARQSQETFDAQKKLRLALIATDARGAEKLVQDYQERIKAAPQQPFATPGQAYYQTGTPPGKVAFLFSGQGSQYVGMGADLAMEFNDCRAVWDAAAELFTDEKALHPVVFPVLAFTVGERQQQEERLRQTDCAQPAIGAVSLSQLALLKMAGVQPDCVAGHSYGELPALYAAGSITSAADLLAASKKRGELMREAASRPGAMTAVLHDATEIIALVAAWNNGVVVANRNSPKQVVLSGPVGEIEETERMLAERGISFKRLPVATAFHSAVVAAGVEPFDRYLATLPLAAPTVPVYANTTAETYPSQPEQIRELLAHQLEKPVLFSDEIRTMYETEAVRIFVEVGPGSVLSRLVDDCLNGREHLCVALDGGKNTNGLTAFWVALGRLAVAGVPVNFLALWSEFATAAEPLPVSPTAVRMNGSLFGKLYPPPGGADALPKPNPEVVELPQPAAPITVPAAPVYLAESSALHNHLFEVQRQFQETLKESHLAFLKAAEAALAQGGSFQPLPGLGHGAGVGFQQPSPQHQVAAAMPMLPAPEPAGKVAPPEPPKNREVPRLDFATLLMQVVSEKTGYPVDMLKPEMELESGLGIDSIKKVEILAALQAVVPELKAADMGQITRLNTLAAIIDFAGKLEGTAATPSPAATAEVSLEGAEPPRSSAQVDFKQILLEVVSEKTGYPTTMLQMEMELEAGLGIDSIKKVEILAALQVAVPELKTADMGQIAKLRTLGEIVALAETATAASGSRTTMAAPGAIEPAPGGIHRQILRRAAKPFAHERMPGLEGAEHLYLVSDNRGVAPLLAARLRAGGINAEVTGVVPPDAGRVIFLKGLDAVANDRTAATALNKEAFDVARAMARLPAHTQKLFVTLQESAGAGQWSGGLAALVKTCQHEWAGASLKAIEIDGAGSPPERLAAAIHEELTRGGAEIEVFIGVDGSRRVPDLQRAVAGEPSRRLADGDVVVVSGGARGITAECLKALAAEAKINIAILGRSALAEEPAWAAACHTDLHLKRALADEAVKTGTALTPMELDRQAKAILSGREVRQSIAELQQKGAAVKYFAVDICDVEAVAAALQETRQEWGSIRVLIHAAGVLADKYLHDKTDEQFNRVFETKVTGLQNLLEATQNDALSHLCCFSSIAARTGNAGQADYAMANAVLTAVCQHEQLRREGQTLVKAIGWGPWDGGMVRPELKAVFASRGIGLIPLEQGAQAFALEMANADGHVDVIISGTERYGS